MATITQALSRIKGRPLHVQGILDTTAVDRFFAAQGYQWRDRQLGPAVTLELFIRQVMEHNESCGWVRHWARGTFTAGAYCRARQRLPLAGLWALVRLLGAQLRAEFADAEPLWHGLRTFYLDGSGISMPDTPELQAAFGQPGNQRPGCGFPVAHLLLGFDAATGMVLDAIPGPLRTHDLADVQWIHRHLAREDLLIGDRAFGSWTHLALLISKGIHALFPIHQRRIPQSERRQRPRRRLLRRRRGGANARSRRRRNLQPRPPLDCRQVWPKPRLKPAWISAEEYAALPESITVRVIRRTVRRPGGGHMQITVVTTLLDTDEYPAQEVMELGRGRWCAELNIRHLKTTMGLEVLKCKTAAGVLKELAIFLLVYNLVRAVMLKAAAQQHLPLARISFADALAWTRCTPVGATLWTLLSNPLRPDRIEPRAVKRRPKEYDRLNRPRWEMRKALENQRKAG